MLLIAAFEIKNRDLAVLVSVLLAGVIPKNFPINTWHSAVWLTLASSASYVLRDDAEWQTAYALLSPIRTTTAKVTNHHGDTVYELHSGLLNKAMVYPLKVVLSDPKELTGHLRNAHSRPLGLEAAISHSRTKLILPWELISTDKTSMALPWPRWSQLPNAISLGQLRLRHWGFLRQHTTSWYYTILPRIASFTGTCFYMKSCHYYLSQYLQYEEQKLSISCREPISHRHTDECLTTRGKIPSP